VAYQFLTVRKERRLITFFLGLLALLMYHYYSQYMLEEKDIIISKPLDLTTAVSNANLLICVNEILN
jgi:hypothetical protein